MRSLLFIIGLTMWCTSLWATPVLSYLQEGEETDSTESVVTAVTDTVVMTSDKIETLPVTTKAEVFSAPETIKAERKVTTMPTLNSIGVSPELQSYFMGLLPDRDTTYTAIEKKGREDKFSKRFSFHTNLIWWAFLMPNAAMELDLKQTHRNHYSVLLHGMLNGKGKNTFGTSFIFNARSVRVEGRKYWRTGKQGHKGYHTEYEKLVTDRNREDFNADSTRGWFYNTYHKVRRNVFSGRTISKPRDWRAYYLGIYAGVDDWNVAIGGNGKQGEGIFAGLSAGWSIPIFPQKFPKEGSLDLELGINVGVKAVRYEAYTREDDTGHYVHDIANSQPNWKICPFPVVQDIHVSLVWRMRGIKHKVDASLIDDYEKKVEKMRDRIWRNKQIADSLYDVREHSALVAPLEIELADATDMMAAIENTKADTSGKALPMLRIAIDLARRDSADMVTLGTKLQQERERELIARELNYYKKIALDMVDKNALLQLEKGKKKGKNSGMLQSALSEEQQKLDSIAALVQQEAKKRAEEEKARAKEEKVRAKEEKARAKEEMEKKAKEKKKAIPVTEEQPTTEEQPVTEEKTE